MVTKILEQLKERYPQYDIGVSVDERNIVTLTGQCLQWQDVVDIGHLVGADDDVKNVVNELTVEGLVIPHKDYTPFVEQGNKLGEKYNCDILIVGAGICGCGIARELAKYDLNIMVADMGDDVATGATKANNGDIHPGHAVKPGTLKAKLNVKGNRMYTKWAEEVGFELIRSGVMYGVGDKELIPQIEKTYNIAKLNGVDGAAIIDGKTAMELEPAFAEHGENVVAALHLPSMGIVESYKVAVALAENAAVNGVKFLFNCTIGDVLTDNGEVTGVVTNKGIIKAKYVINCAGLYADEISAMAGDKSYTLHNRKGTIAILDKNLKPKYHCLGGFATLAMAKAAAAKAAKKDANSKGGGMDLTPEMNILMGPSAHEVPDKEDTATSREGLAYAMGRSSYDKIHNGHIIRMFAGARPADYKEDFVIEMSPITHGFVNCGAIQSPGLASAPAIAEYVENILIDDFAQQGKTMPVKSDYNPIRKREIEFRHMTREAQAELIAKDARYGRVICRCEQITEGEILDAIHSPVVPTSVDAIKRRTRAGMGRCQGGFCQPRVVELLARELGQDWVDVNLTIPGTNILVDNNRKADK